MSNLLDFMNERRKTLGLTVVGLSRELNLNHPTVHKYLSGERPLPRDRAERFRTELCGKDQNLIDEFNSLFEKDLAGRGRSPLELPIDSASAKLRMATLDYWPFAGEPPLSELRIAHTKGDLGTAKAFMDKFIEKTLNLAVIQLETVVLGTASDKGAMMFDMNSRIDAIERRKVDLLLNLMSLQRTKRLTFIPVPIRIAVNAVIFEDSDLHAQPRGRELATHARRQRESRLEAAKEVLLYGRQPTSQPFLVVGVKNEIGAVFMEQDHGFRDGGTNPLQGASDPKNPKKDCLLLQNSLDAVVLVAAMRRASKSHPVMLVCDEHTAIAVLGELGTEGELVLPPNSDQAVIHSMERRIPPSFYFGVGLRRSNNDSLIEYLQHAFSSCLSIETETIAEWYRDLYYQLVGYINRRLPETALYTGGILPSGFRQGDPPTDGIGEAGWSRLLSTVAEQNARAVARRMLSLSRRSLETLPREMASWRPVLGRARELIQVKDGGDRGRIREIIFYCANMALGLALYPSTPSIALLRKLTSTRGPSADWDLFETYEVDIPQGDHWLDFLYLMELELDMPLIKPLRYFPGRRFKDSSQLGHLISRIQVLLEESSRDSRLVLTIRRFDEGSDTKAYSGLRAMADGIDGAAAAQLVDDELRKESRFVVRLLAFRLGEAAGFLDAEFLPPEDVSGIHRSDMQYSSTSKIQHGGSIFIHRLYVPKQLRGGGISRRLIRRIVEYGNDSSQREIWLAGPSWSPDDRDKFLRAGFTQQSEYVLSFPFILDDYPREG